MVAAVVNESDHRVKSRHTLVLHLCERDPRLVAVRRELEQTREVFWAVCEPVNLPKIARDAVNYFCARNPVNVDAVKKNQPRRLTFYDALNTYLRAYSTIAN
jgi:hypothetical protein